MTTKKRHTKQTINNIQSTKKLEQTPPENALVEKLETRSNQVFFNIINPQQQIETNLTGQFPVKPKRGNK